MADSKLLPGRKPGSIDCALEASAQLSLEIILAPVESKSDTVGSCRVLARLNGGLLKLGPMARTRTVLLPMPLMMKPPIMTLSPSPTWPRVEILLKRVATDSTAPTSQLTPHGTWKPRLSP